jgi:hypothetical protein
MIMMIITLTKLEFLPMVDFTKSGVHTNLDRNNNMASCPDDPLSG